MDSAPTSRTEMSSESTIAASTATATSTSEAPSTPQPVDAPAATSPAPFSPDLKRSITASPSLDIKRTVTADLKRSPKILIITILVQSGARHQFQLDRAYLDRHAIKSSTTKEPLSDPLEMSVWQLKECIWKDWREDWDQRPASALFIKLIQYGAYLQDSNPLKDCRLNVESTNVIHMAIRPAEAGDDELTQRSTKGAFGQSRERESTSRGASPGCRCVIL